MKINIFCVGKIKESFFEEAIKEYSKRISKYAKLEIIEVKDESIPANASALIEEEIKEKECNKIIDKLPNNAYTCALDLGKEQFDSIFFSSKLENMFIKGKGTINFIIGGSLGLSKTMKEKVDESISFSKMTFPHQLCRVILLEQIYRAFRILNNEPYHK
ncbi:MAG: 23S rRNA (pseudouridine(1915)-N(3))-methyltransferase RlmH [Bacilli bacterium]|nr:23S rRNA (pseudouridine(1915)-N(3))-methyltransferase RlmH [Bacilli bacterium]